MLNLKGQVIKKMRKMNAKEKKKLGRKDTPLVIETESGLIVTTARTYDGFFICQKG